VKTGSWGEKKARPQRVGSCGSRNPVSPFQSPVGLHRAPLDRAQGRRRSRRPDRDALAGSVPRTGRTKRAPRLRSGLTKRACNSWYRSVAVQQFLVLRVFSPWKRKHSKRLLGFTRCSAL